MNGGRGLILLLAFLVVLFSATIGYFVIQTYSLSSQPLAEAEPPEARQFTIVMQMLGMGKNEFHRWTPGVLVVNKGDTVILRVVNADDDAAHGFALAAYDIFEPRIAPGKAVTFQFVAKKPGIFHFSCATERCAKDHGDQTGQLVVLGPS